MTVFVYEDSKCDETLDYIKDSTDYALTGAVFSQDK